MEEYFDAGWENPQICVECYQKNKKTVKTNLVETINQKIKGDDQKAINWDSKSLKENPFKELIETPQVTKVHYERTNQEIIAEQEAIMKQAKDAQLAKLDKAEKEKLKKLEKAEKERIKK